MKKKFRRALAIMLALLMTGSAFVDYYISVRADEDEGGGVIRAVPKLR